MVTKDNPDKSDAAFYAYINSVSGIEDENRALKEQTETLERELEKFKRTPLLVCEIKELIDNKAVLRLQNGNEFLVEISKECEPLKAGDGVLAEQKNLTVLKKLGSPKKFDVEKFVVIDKPTITWDNIGGLTDQVRSIKEVVELPLKKPQLFRDIGIVPPKGVLLFGPPGTGKTLLAKAVAASTKSTFIEVVGSELVQKFIGEGAKLVKEMFQLAREKAPSIVFIDELDSIAATRVDVGTSGEREVQRTFMQLLSEIDGFEALDNVKIIGCTNREDILDTAITRPGRLDRKIFVPLPEAIGRKEIFKIHTKPMKMDKLDIDELVKKTENFSGADIQSVCTEAGYVAIRENRNKVTQKDFLEAITIVTGKTANSDYKRMFG
ncbi:MAG: AAA family ATPase [Nanoarchaeota archaeon]